MDKVRLGRTEIVVNKNGFGALPIQRVSKEEAAKILRKAYDNGVRLFDTARAYTDSEEKIRFALGDVREKIYITTKTMAENAEGFWKDLETSLKTLGTDYIDVYQFHNPPFCPKPGGEDGLYDAVLEAKRQGKVRHIGITNHRLAVAKEAIESGLYDTLQFPFSYLSAETEKELTGLCKEQDMGFLAMKALAGGLINQSALAYAFMNEYDNVLPIWGIQRESELDEFLSYQENPPKLAGEIAAQIAKDIEEFQGDFCRGCGYCMPCPADIEINNCARMSLMIRRAVSENLLNEETQEKMKRIEGCLECGQCKSKCPYGLDTPELLKKNYKDYKEILEGESYMRNHEVTKRQDLLLPDGNLREPGWSRSLVQTYKRSQIRAPKFRIKEWDYYLVLNEDFAGAFTLSDDGYIGLQSVSLLNFKEGWEHTETILNAFPMGKFGLPETSEEGDIEYRDKRLHMAYTVRDGERRIRCFFKNFYEGKTFSCDITLRQPKMDTMVIATPFEKKKAFYYNQKMNCMPASGYMKYDGKEYIFNENTDFGTLDWGRGVWTYDNRWYWGSGNTVIDGKSFGFNIGYGFGDTSAASENMLFYDGVGHKLDDVNFHIPKDSYMKPWKFTSSDGRFEMDFVPVLDRAAKTNALIIESDQHQVFGRMSGTAVLDDGKEIRLRDVLCFAEDVHNRY